MDNKQLTGTTDMPETRTKILIADDHAVVAEGLASVLKKEPGFIIVGRARDGLEALSMVESLKPHVVILDQAMPKMDGLEATREIMKRSLATKIVVYSMFSDLELVLSFLKEGVSGYVLKGRPMSEMLLALRAAVEGGFFYSEPVGKKLQEYVSGAKAPETREHELIKGLSEREKEIFVFLADGLPTKEIAQRLHISPKTVESHKYNIIDKLEVKNLTGLTKMAVKQKLIKI